MSSSVVVKLVVPTLLSSLLVTVKSRSRSPQQRVATPQKADSTRSSFVEEECPNVESLRLATRLLEPVTIRPIRARSTFHQTNDNLFSVHRKSSRFKLKLRSLPHSPSLRTPSLSRPLRRILQPTPFFPPWNHTCETCNAFLSPRSPFFFSRLFVPLRTGLFVSVAQIGKTRGRTARREEQTKTMFELAFPKEDMDSKFD